VVANGVGPRNLAVVGRADCRHLAKTVERSCATATIGSATKGGDAAYSQITYYEQSCFGLEHERTNEVYLARSANLPTGLYILPSVISSFFVNERVDNGWLPVEAEAHQSWPPKKLQKHNKKHISNQKWNSLEIETEKEEKRTKQTRSI